MKTHSTITRRVDYLIDYSIITLETIGHNFSNSLENYLHACERFDGYIYTQFLEYGKKHAKYDNYSQGDNTYIYIASALFNKYLQFCNKKLETSSSIVLSFSEKKSCMLHVFAIIKKLLNALNFANNGEYITYNSNGLDTLCYLPNYGIVSTNKTVLKKDGNIIGKNVRLMDILKQWENRDARTEQRKVTYFEGEDKTKQVISSLESNLPSQELDLQFKNAILKAIRVIDKKLINYCKVLEHDNQNGTAKSYLSRWNKNNGFSLTYSQVLDVVQYYKAM